MKVKIFVSTVMFAVLIVVTSARASTLKVGVLYPYNSLVGSWINNSVKMAADEINAKGGILGRKIVLYPADTSHGAGKMISGIRKLATLDHVNLMIGGLSSGSVLASLPTMAQYKMLWLGTGAADPAIIDKIKSNFGKYKYYFRIGTMDSVDQGKFIGDFIVNYIKPKYGFTKAAIVSNDFIYSHDISETAAKILKAHGMKIVYRAYFPLGTTDFSTIFAKVKSSGAQIIIDSVVTPAGIPLVKQWNTLKVPAVLIGANAMALNQSFFKQTGGESGYTTDVYPDGGPVALNKNTLSFIGNYYKRWKSYPGFISFPAYNALYVLKAAAEHSHSLHTNTLIKAIENVRFPIGGNRGASPEAFTKYHDLRYGGKYVIAPVFQWQPGGRYVAVWPKSLATGKWMLPDWIKASK